MVHGAGNPVDEILNRAQLGRSAGVNSDDVPLVKELLGGGPHYAVCGPGDQNTRHDSLLLSLLARPVGRTDGDLIYSGIRRQIERVGDDAGNPLGRDPAPLTCCGY